MQVSLCMNIESVRKMSKIYFGKTTMTHGLKGELKFFTDFSQKEHVFHANFPVYIKDIMHKITSVRPHKNYYLITLDNKNDINEVENFRNQEIYIEEEDLKLQENEIILETLIDYNIKENEIILGKVTDILYNKGGILLEVIGNKKFYIPYHDNFVERINKEKKEIIVKNAKDLIL